MKDLLLLAFGILIVALISLFQVCWIIRHIVYRSIRSIIPASSEPPEYVSKAFYLAIAELQELGFNSVGYQQIERANLNETFDWGILLARGEVYAGISIPQLIIPSDPPLNISFTTFFADQSLKMSANQLLRSKLLTSREMSYASLHIFENRIFEN